ncbi:MAG: OmpA family protein [Chitinophagaceae bacterium]|nr:OmpA family protein [Chitinophagaceae bacterium]
MSTSQALIFTLILITSFTSCNLYDGPVRDSGYTSRKPLPPPPEKVFAEPLTKSEYMFKTYSEMKEKLPEAEVGLIEDSIKLLFPDNITYIKGELYPSAFFQEPLERFSTLLKKYKKTNILVTGHTDNRGKESKNVTISTQRAKIIRENILSNGVNPARLEYWGLGSTSPIADNATEEGRKRNRRVEFVVLYDDKQ